MKRVALGTLVTATILAGTVVVQAQGEDEASGDDELKEYAESMQEEGDVSDAELDEADEGDDEAEKAEHAEEASSEDAAGGEDTSSGGADGPRFRFGASAGPGFFKVKTEIGPGEMSCKYVGADLRLGAQINDLVGVYAQPTLGYYATGDETEGVLAIGGLVGIAALLEFTFMDRFFAGAGIGYTVYNNPAGISPLLRFGGYPLVSRSKKKIRRKGLMVGIDLRMTKLEGLKNIFMPTLNVGYEAF